MPQEESQQAHPLQPSYRELLPGVDENAGDRDSRFWLGLLYAALAGYAAVLATISGHVALTWTQPHRGLIVAILAAAVIFALGCYRLRYRLVIAWWRVWFFGAWNTLSFLFLYLFCALDDGVNSWLAALLLLPMLYLAIGYPLRAVLVCGALGIVGYGGLVLLSTGPVYSDQVLLQAMALGIGWLLAIIGAVNRERQDRDLRRLRQRLETLAATDELTRCLNKRAFMISLEREIARAARYEYALALLLIDLDHFKRVNDRYGHLMGDAALQHIGAILRSTARTTDIVGRFGGDELALLAPEADAAMARTLAERLRARMHSHTLQIEITLSIGICAAIPSTESAAVLLRRADQALYEAKRRGRDQIVLCDAVDENDTAVPSGNSPPRVINHEAGT